MSRDIGAGAIKFSKQAVDFIESLPESDQKRIVDHLTTLYAKVLEFLLVLRIQSFFHWSEANNLNLLTNRETMFTADEWVFYVNICSETMSWRVRLIKSKAVVAPFEKRKLSAP